MKPETEFWKGAGTLPKQAAMYLCMYHVSL